MEEWCRRAVLKCRYVHCIYTEYSIHRRIGILCHHTEIKVRRYATDSGTPIVSSFTSLLILICLFLIWHACLFGHADGGTGKSRHQSVKCTMASQPEQRQWLISSPTVHEKLHNTASCAQMFICRSVGKGPRPTTNRWCSVLGPVNAPLWVSGGIWKCELFLFRESVAWLSWHVCVCVQSPTVRPVQSYLPDVGG